jgi:rhodanese-related sulfurtransferase
MKIGYYTSQQVRELLLQKKEVALLDVREEAIFATAHPLFAANLPLSRLETEVYNRIPNRLATIVVYDNGEGLAATAAERLIGFGYKNVHLLKDGLAGWRAAGGEIFIDVNTPSKAFGELVESKRHTPSLSATEVKAMIDNHADIVILDARRFDEYQTMSIPSGISVPGAELVLRAAELVSRPETTVIVNCAGRTRSIIGTQSLVNAGINNPVFALRNGTIGWTLAGQQLEHHQSRSGGYPDKKHLERAAKSARLVAERAGVKPIDQGGLHQLLQDTSRTHYLFDVRLPHEYQVGHLPCFLSAPGGQLVQETDHYTPVRGARIIVYDDDGVRANMTASWLAQMAWEVYVFKADPAQLAEKGEAPLNMPALPELNRAQFISADLLHDWLGEEKSIAIIDLAPERHYAKYHIPGAWYVLRSQFAGALKNLPPAEKFIITSPDGIQAHFTVPELKELLPGRLYLLEGGTAAWIAADHPTENGTDNSRFASEPSDRYRRPYEGVNNTPEAMQAYLDWEYGLVEQLERDGTHGFFVV